MILPPEFPPVELRCSWCRKYELPCGDATHDNVLARYVPLIESTHFTADAARTDVPIVRGEPAVRMSRPPYVPNTYIRTGEVERRQRLIGIAFCTLVMAAMLVVTAMVLLATPATPDPDYVCPGQVCQPYPIPQPAP